MKIEWNKKYTTISVYAFIVICLSIVFHQIASEVNLFKIKVGDSIRVLLPFIIGFTIAYLFNFILRFYEECILNFKVINNIKKKYKRAISILLTYATVILLLFLFINFIFPQITASLVGLAKDTPEFVDNTSKKIIELSQNFDINEEFSKILVGRWNEFVSYLVNFSTNLIPIIGNIIKNVLSSVWNIVLGVIISIYLLMDKENFVALGRKITFAFFSKEKANKILELSRRSNDIFGKFIVGKILDSFIVGILTFIILTITKMPYTTLVSFIIAITNIIPFFGPFIGAVPSIIIIFLVSPIKALWFILIVFVIQQIDGNIIGPKILGDSLGISAFWILFALLVTGKVLGVIGLIIGVPVFAIIYSITKDIVESRLKKKELPHETKDYTDRKSVV